MRRTVLMRGVFLTATLILVGAVTRFSWVNGSLAVHFFEVGYGDAILLRLPGERNAMIDTGSPETAPQVVERLTKLGISRLDFVVLTHSHPDHCGGLEKIIEHVDIGRVYINAADFSGDERYRALLSDVARKFIPVRILRYGEKIDLGSTAVSAVVLHPRILSGSPNEDSLSLLLTHGQNRFWLTADIQPHGQDAIIRDVPEVLSADCVQVPHHGGILSESFMSLPPDTIFVMSTGANTYGKPFTEYADRLSGRLLRTDREGDIVLISNGSGVQVLHE